MIAVLKGIDCSLCVDDFVLCVRGTSLCVCCVLTMCFAMIIITVMVDWALKTNYTSCAVTGVFVLIGVLALIGVLVSICVFMLIGVDRCVCVVTDADPHRDVLGVHEGMAGCLPEIQLLHPAD